jgi:hypothetical protein
MALAESENQANIDLTENLGSFTKKNGYCNLIDGFL